MGNVFLVLRSIFHGVLAGLLIIAFIVSPAIPMTVQAYHMNPVKRVSSDFQSNPDQDNGWVRAQEIGGSCTPDGICSGTENPGDDNLYEYRPDRRFLGRDPIDFMETYPPPGELAEHGGDRTAVQRTYCHVDRNRTRYYFGWATGTWHHGASWSFRLGDNNRRIWTGPLWPHWAFWHEDECDPPAVTATPTLSPTPSPTLTPRGFSLQVRACTSSGPLLPNGDVYISAWTIGNSWNMNEQTSSVSVDLPGQYLSISYDVTINPRWSVTSGSTSQRDAMLPHSRVIVASNSTACSAASPAGTPTRTATPLPPGCPGGTTWLADNTVPILAPRVNGVRLSSDPNNPTLLQSNQRAFQFVQDGVLHRDANNDDVAEYNAYLVVYYQPAATTRVAHSAWYVRRHVDAWNIVHWDLAWRGWPNSSGLAQAPNPQMYSNLPPAGLPSGSFNPGLVFSANFGVWRGGVYRVVARSNGDRRTYYPCPVPFREQSFYFRIPRFTPTPTSTLPPGQPTPTPTNTPTPTPTLPPPPPPPQPAVDVRLWLHSPYDRQQAINKTASGEFTWPMGERLNWTPYVELSLPEDVDPNYDFRAKVVAWSYVSSLEQAAESAPDALGRHGCREREQPSGEEVDAYGVEDLQGCVYAYKHEPEIADILQQAHVYWSAILPPDMDADVYVYKLPQPQPADLTFQFKVLVEVVEARNDQVVASRTEVLQRSFTVNFAVPRSAR